MSVKIIKDRLRRYNPQTEQEEINALKEIFQEIALAALSRANFFKYAAFQGGTCLRIFYGLQRFSEDLDFVLKDHGPHDWNKFLSNMKDEFLAFGIDIEITDRSKTNTNIQKVFLKETSLGQILTFPRDDFGKRIKIKLEVDVQPPAGSQYKVHYLDFPYAFSVINQDLPSLFASKSHALLCRDYVKGRDWFDFIWYVSQKVTPNLTLLKNALHQFGPWKGMDLHINPNWYLKNMKTRIESIDWEEAKQDIERFLLPIQKKSLEIWQTEFFLDRLKKLSEVFLKI